MTGNRYKYTGLQTEGVSVHALIPPTTVAPHGPTHVRACMPSPDDVCNCGKQTHVWLEIVSSNRIVCRGKIKAVAMLVIQATRLPLGIYSESSSQDTNLASSIPRVSHAYVYELIPKSSSAVGIDATTATTHSRINEKAAADDGNTKERGQCLSRASASRGVS